MSPERRRYPRSDLRLRATRQIGNQRLPCAVTRFGSGGFFIEDPGAAAHPGDLVVVDGTTGTVVLNPSAATLAAARRAVTAFARERQRFARFRRLPAETLDGEAVELQANLELPLELPLIAQSGAVGIGLLRTEFLFMNRETVPNEDTQTDVYRSIVEAMNGDPVAIRVLDWGGEPVVHEPLRR